MTTRLHRLWQPGNSRPRVYLPNFWMKIIRPEVYERLRPNQIKFMVSPEMTVADVREYLTKIYRLPVRQVATANIQGRLFRDMPDIPSSIVLEKEHDYKVAFVTLRRDVEFSFPNLFENADAELDQKKLEKQDEMKKEAQKYKRIHSESGRWGVWFNT